MFAIPTNAGNEMDDLEAVRAIVEVVGKFEKKEDQERIVRWSLEKLGLLITAQQSVNQHQHEGEERDDRNSSNRNKGPLDIKTFVTEKSPSSDNQFAATVAYYYAFEAPQNERKGSIGPSDLTEACRMVGRSRLGDPAKTLANAMGMGYLDKIDRGAFKLNTVGENLVAITLPPGTGEKVSRTRKKATPAKKKSPPTKNGRTTKKKNR